MDIKPVATPLNRDRLADSLETQLPQVVFAYLHGSSAASGVVPAHSDLDLALFLDPSVLDESKATANNAATGEDAAPAPVATVHPLSEVYAAVQRVAEFIAPGVRCDIGILNGTEPVFRFEVLKGHLLFCRDREQWLRFYSLTCREYESQLFHYEKQHRYRLEANA